MSSRARWPARRALSARYDCNGLPIELRVDRELGPKKRDMSLGRSAAHAAETRDATRRDDRRVQALRSSALGSLLLPMNPQYRRTLPVPWASSSSGVSSTKEKAVHWVYTAARPGRAEVEYEDHSSPSIYVDFR